MVDINSCARADNAHARATARRFWNLKSDGIPADGTLAAGRPRRFRHVSVAALRARYGFFKRRARACPGSVHLRRRGDLARPVEILGWCLSAKGAVGPVVVVEMGEGIDVLVEAIEVVGQVMACVELEHVPA